MAKFRTGLTLGMNHFKKISALALASLLYSLSSFATCVQLCDDTDAGDDPRSFGVVVVNTSCSPPGGPVNTTRSEYFDRCEDGVHTEFACSGGGVGTDGAKKRTVRCAKCDPVRKGVCLQPGKTTSDGAANDPTYSCSSTTGGGGHPTDEPTVCPDPSCANPKEGCSWQMVKDENGCLTCGTMVCGKAATLRRN